MTADRSGFLAEFLGRSGCALDAFLISYHETDSSATKAMQYQVLVQKPSEQHFVASIIGLSNVVADGKTEEEAIAKIKVALKSQLATAKVVTINVEADPADNTKSVTVPNSFKSVGLGNSHRGDLSERVDELLWQN